MSIESNLRAELIEHTGGVICWCCHWSPASFRPRLWMVQAVQLSHILGGQHGGTSARSNTRENVTLMCDACHRSYGRERVCMDEPGEYWPPITLANALDVKRDLDPEYYDPKFLNRLLTGRDGRGWRLPDPEPLPEFRDA